MTIYTFIDLHNICRSVRNALNEPRLNVSHLAGSIKIGLYATPVDWDGRYETLPPDTWKTLFVAKDYDEAARWLRALTSDMLDFAQPRKTFRMQLRRLLPGSVTASGGVIDYQGVTHRKGPCWVPYRFGIRNDRDARVRSNALNDAGWRTINVMHDKYPGIPPTRDLVCVINPVKE